MLHGSTISILIFFPVLLKHQMELHLGAKQTEHCKHMQFYRISIHICASKKKLTRFYSQKNTRNKKIRKFRHRGRSGSRWKFMCRIPRGEEIDRRPQNTSPRSGNPEFGRQPPMGTRSLVVPKEPFPTPGSREYPAL